MELILILLLGFVFRIVFIIANSSDTYLHLWFIRKSEQNSFGEHKAFNSIVEGDFPYPSLPHYLVSLLPNKFQLPVAHLANILYDCIAIVLLYFVAQYCFVSVWGLKTIQATDISSSAIATMLFATSPILFPVSARLKSIGGRTFGGMLALIYFISLGAVLVYEDYWYLIAIAISGLGVLMSSQFAAQVIILFSITVSILWMSLIPLVAILLVFVVGLSVKPLGIRRILFAKTNHYIWYFRNFWSHPLTGNRNKISDIIKLPYFLITSPRYFLDLIFTKLTPVIAIISVPLLWPFIYWGFEGSFDFTYIFQDTVLRYLLYLVLASIIVFVLTSFKRLLFLGQAERYFEFSVGPICILFVYAAIINDTLISSIAALFILQLLIIFINLFWTIKDNLKSSISPNNDSCFNSLVSFLSERNNLRILFVPTKFNFLLDVSMNRSDFKYFMPFISSNKLDGFKYMEMDEMAYGYLKTDISTLKEKYNANTLIVKKSELKIAGKYGKYDFSKLKQIYENELYIVYDIN